MADYTISLDIIGKDDASPAIHSTHKALVNVKGIASSALGGVAKGLTAIAGISLVGILGGIGALTAGLVDCVKGAVEAENITAELNAVLKSTGGVSGMTAESINDIALSLSKVTRFEDDSIVKGQSMLLTFTNIGKDVFPQATEAMLDMAQKFGSMDAASVQLGKALNDPIAGVGALRKIGVALTEAQETQIKKFMQVGDIAGAQKIILAELGVELGGLAKAAGETLAGKMDILKNRFGNVKDAVGAALIPVLTDLMNVVIMPLLPVIEELGKGFSGVVSGLAGLFSKKGDLEALGDASLQLTDGLYGIAKAFGLSDTKAEIFSQNIAELLDKFVNVISAIQEAGLFSIEFWEALEAPPAIRDALMGIIGTIERLFAAMSKGDARGIASALGIPPEIISSFQSIGHTIENITRAVLPTLIKVAGEMGAKFTEIAKDVMPFVTEQVEKFSAWFAENGPLISKFVMVVSEKFGDIAKAVLDFWKVAKPILDGALTSIMNLAKIVMQIATGDWAGAWQTMKDQHQNAFDSFKQITSAFGDWVASWMGTTMADIGKQWSQNWDMLVVIVKDVWNKITGSISEGWANITKSVTGGVKSASDSAVNGLNAIPGKVGGVWDSIAKGATSAWGDITGTVTDAGNSLRKGISDTWTKITTATKAGWKNIGKGLLAGIDAMDAIVKTGLEAIRQVVLGVWTFITADTDTKWKMILKVIGDVVRAIWPIVKSALDKVQSIVSDAWQSIRNDVSKWWDQISSQIRSAVNAIPGIVADAFDDVINAIADAWQTVRDDVSKWWNQISSQIRSAVNAIPGIVSSAFENVIQAITDAWRSIRDSVSTWWQQITTAISNAIAAIPAAVAWAIQSVVAIGSSIVRAIAQGITDLWNAAGGVTAAIVTFLEDLVDYVWSGQLFDDISAIGTSIVSAITTGIISLWNSAVGVVSTITGFLGGLVQSLVDGSAFAGIRNAGAEIVNAIIAGVQANWQNFVDWLRDLIVGIFGGEEGMSVAITPKLVPGFRGIGSMTGAGGQFSQSTNVTYNLYVSTTAPVSTVLQDFGMLQSLAGV